MSPADLVMAPAGHDNDLTLRFWGARGSHPVCGSCYAEFGGSTPCVEVRCGERLFVIDAGSGLASFGVALMPEPPQKIDLLFSHLHLDHVSGLPFFKPALTTGTTISTWCGNLGGENAEPTLRRVFSPPLFPVTLDQFPGRFEHHGFRAGETLTFDDGMRVKTCPLKHPSGATGYRFDHGGRSLCYVSDIEHEEPWPPENLKRFVAGADLVIYDAMFSEDEYCRCRGWGHSTWQAGVALCRDAGAKTLAVFHLHPLDDDARLRAIEAEVDRALPGSFVAREGQTLVLPARMMAERLPLPA